MLGIPNMSKSTDKKLKFQNRHLDKPVIIISSSIILFWEYDFG